VKRFPISLCSAAERLSARCGSLREQRDGEGNRLPTFLRFFAIGIAALFLASAGVAAELAADHVIVPKAAPEKAEVAERAASNSGPLTFVAVIALGCAGGWMLWRGRSGALAGLRGGVRAPRNLVVEETRSLGNRQYLVVASYQDKKFLLGVCQGRIDLLSPLHEGGTAPEKPRA
jgi:flagellar protein FliO/FliZ